MARRDFYSALVYAREVPVIGVFAYYVLKLMGVEIPRSVEFGKDFTLVHGGFGVVIHPNTKIGDGVKIYPGVTLGRADIHLPIDESAFKAIFVDDEVILSPGAKVLGGDGILRVGKGTIVGANAVLLESTEPGEIWAGVPARRVGHRE
jgi:serine O-acetyltransferase